MSHITIAPAFINGFLGIPFSTSKRVRSLKGSPEGSTSTLFYKFLPRIENAMAKLNTLEIL